MVITFLCTIKINFLQYTWKLPKYKSKLITVISLRDRDQTGNKTCQQNFFRKKISMSGMKVSSVVRKCVFYRPELTGKWVPHGNESKFLKFKTEVN